MSSWQSGFGTCLTFAFIKSSLQSWTTTGSSLLLSGELPVSVLATLDKRDEAFMENELLLHESLKAAFTWQQVLIQYKHEHFHRGITLLSCRYTVFCAFFPTEKWRRLNLCFLHCTSQYRYTKCNVGPVELTAVSTLPSPFSSPHNFSLTSLQQFFLIHTQPWLFPYQAQLCKSLIPHASLR